MDKLSHSIQKTLAYADLFNHALTTEELYTLLIEHRLKNINQLEEHLGQKNSGHQTAHNLTGRNNLAKLKHRQIEIKQQKIQTAQKALWVFSLIPWISLVGITGSVAGGSPNHHDDIDIIIITQPHRLWISRLLLIPLLNILKKRRKPDDNPNQVNDKLCLNMWLSADNLAETHQDIYVANELARVTPLLNRQQTYQKYIQANSWIEQYLPNFFAKLNLSTLPPDGEFPVTHDLLSRLNALAERIQKHIMRQPTNETVNNDRLAFHPHDYRSEILSKYHKKIAELGINK